LSLNTHTFAPNGVLAVPGHTLGADTPETSAELTTDSELESGALTEADAIAITIGTATAAIAARIVITAAIRPMLTRPATSASFADAPAAGDSGAASG
jgi:hypothetical protein